MSTPKKSPWVLWILCMLPLCAIAQAPDKGEIRARIWGDTSSFFKETQVPERWKNESAVILALSREYSITPRMTYSGRPNGQDYFEKLEVHCRVKLQDKAAVGEFSVLQFSEEQLTRLSGDKVRDFNIIGIRVIKTDGRMQEVDLNQSYEADASSDGELKIPLSNLEVGDIIDYLSAVQVMHAGIPGGADEYLLEGKYPILYQRFGFRMPARCAFYRAEMNGAPKFSYKEKDREHIYTLVDTLRGKSPELAWDFPLRTAPHFRYRVLPGPAKYDAKEVLGESLKYIAAVPQDISLIQDFMRVNFKNEKDPARLAEELFYLLRHPVYKNVFWGTEMKNPTGEHAIPDNFFALMHVFLKARKIDHDLLFASDRALGPVDSSASYDPFELLIRVNTDPPIMLGRPGIFELPGSIDPGREGAEAVCFPLKAECDTLPLSTVDDNVVLTQYSLQASAGDPASLEISRSLKARGHGRKYYQYLLVTDYDYLKACDLPKYQAEKSAKVTRVLNEYNREMAKLEQRQAQDYQERDKLSRQALEQEMGMGVTSYRDFKLHQIGLWKDAPGIEFSDVFVLDELSSKAGPNTLIKLGRLIGTQAKFEEGKSRTRDIYMDYPRSYHNEIVLEIPEGYGVEGLENFRFRVENSTGGFLSTAVQEGRQVLIKTRKYYLGQYHPASKWPELTAFMKAANSFTEAKLLLKKL